MALHGGLAFEAFDLLFHHSDDVIAVGAVGNVIAAAFFLAEREHQQNEARLAVLAFGRAVEGFVQARATAVIVSRYWPSIG